MRYLKLFEAFESSLLSSTLKFIDKSQIKDFKNILSIICSLYDMPMSNLRDDMFEYLAFDKAMLVNKKVIASDCNKESDWIKGEFCKNGRVKRSWGNGVRTIDCNYCNGSGKESPKYDISKVKFWFDLDGKIVKTTISDGTIKRIETLTGEFSRNLSDYEQLDMITEYDKFSLLSDSYIYIGSIGAINNIIAYIHKDGMMQYIFQDAHNGGGSMDIVNNISTHSLVISSNIFNSYFKTNESTGCILLKPNSNKNIEISAIPLNDKEVSITRYGLTSRGFISKSSLKDAHFSIILDIDKLSGSEYTKKSEILDIRKNSKKDAYSLISNDDIKKTNIERYISEIIKKSSIDADSSVKNIKSITMRVLGGVHVLYFIIEHNKLSDISRISNYLYDIITKDSDNDLDYNINRINSYISSSMTSTRNSLVVFNKTELEMLKLAESRDDDNVIDIHNSIKKLSKFIYDIIKNRDIKTIEDMEILVNDLEYIRNLCHGNRISLHLISDYFQSMLGNGWSSSNTYYKLYSQDFNKVKSNIDSITHIIERKLK